MLIVAWHFSDCESEFSVSAIALQICQFILQQLQFWQILQIILAKHICLLKKYQNFCLNTYGLFIFVDINSSWYKYSNSTQNFTHTLITVCLCEKLPIVGLFNDSPLFVQWFTLKFSILHGKLDNVGIWNINIRIYN